MIFILQIHIEQSVESNFFKKFKAIASLLILRPYFRFFFFFFFKKKNIYQKIQSSWKWESSSNYFNCSS